MVMSSPIRHSLFTPPLTTRRLALLEATFKRQEGGGVKTDIALTINFDYIANTNDFKNTFIHKLVKPS